MEQGTSPRRSAFTRRTEFVAALSPLLLVLATSLAADTTVYRCSGAAGTIEFSQRPCNVGEREEEVTIQDRKTGWVPTGIPKATKSKKSGKPRSRKRKTGGTETAATRARREEQCWKKRQMLEETNWKLRRGYKAGQGVKLRRRRRTYEEYISRYCD